MSSPLSVSSADPPQPKNGLLRERVREVLPKLGKKQRLVAEFCVGNPSIVLFGTVTDVAKGADVDPATVVRFAQTLGFSGFTEFRDALRAGYPSLRSAVQRVDDELATPSSGLDTAAVIDRVRVRTLQNLEETVANLDPRLVDEVVDQFLAAGRVLIMAAGQSEVLAIQLYRILQTAQIPAQILTDWFDLLYAGSGIRDTDVLFGITVWHYSRATIEGLRVAREAGAWCALMTDVPYAPGTDVANLTFLFSTRAVGEYLSPVAGSVVIDCIAGVLAARDPERMKYGFSHQTKLAAMNSLLFQ